jgi:hypothetical protein
MQIPTSARKTLVTAATFVAFAALALGATACTSASTSTQSAPASTSTATRAQTASATTTAAASGATPTAAEGKTIVKTSCIGRCHQSSLLDKRYSASKSQSIAADMGSKAGLTTAQQTAVAAYFAR